MNWLKPKQKAIKKMQGVAMEIKKYRGRAKHSQDPAEEGRGGDEGEKVPSKKNKTPMSKRIM